MSTVTHRDSLVVDGRIVMRMTPRRSPSPMMAYPDIVLCGKNPHIINYWTEDGQGRVAQERRKKAQAVCFSCPLRLTCLEWADRTRQEGVYGGTTTHGRKDRQATRRLIMLYESQGVKRYVIE